MKRFSVIAVLALLATVALLTNLPSKAQAQGNRGGRIYSPKRLRVRPEPMARGRIQRDPRKAPTNPRQPARRRALIPNPEKQAKGGKGYTKRGKYYYQNPKPIRVGGNPKRRIERIKIPHPNAKYR